jgi:hypothetical protein
MTIQQHASFDSSAAELNATSKLVRAWESKNAKNAAKAGGISMMALSLAACGGSSTTTATTPTVETPATDASVNKSLSTDVAAVEGGSGVDTFSGTISGTAPTIQAGDSIDGKGGADTLTVSVSGTAAVTMAGVSVSNVETVRVADVSTAGTTTINLAGQTGISTLESLGSAQGGLLTFTNVDAPAALALSNTSGAGTVSVVYKATAVAGTEAQTINLTNAAATGTVTIGSVENVTINSASASSLSLVSSAAQSVTINGGAEKNTFDLSSLGATKLTTVDASGSTGAQTITVDFGDDSALDGGMTVTGGSGADVFKLSAAMGDTDTLNGGDGIDTISVTSTANTTTAAIASDKATITSVESLSLTAANDAGGASADDYVIDFDLVEGVESVTLVAKDDDTQNDFDLDDMNSTQANAISLGYVAGATGAIVKLDLKDGTGTTDTATVNVTNLTGVTTTIDDDNNNIESLTINVTSSAASAVISPDASSYGTKITVTGGEVATTANARLIDLDAVALTTKALDMSGVIADTSVKMGVSDITVTGGSGKDKIDMVATWTTKDVIDGGDGTDTLVVRSADAIAAAATSTSNIEWLEVSGTANSAVAINADYWGGISNVRFTGTNTQSVVSNLKEGAEIELDGAAAATTLSLKAPNGTNDTINLDLDGAGVTYNVTAANVETINVEANGSTGTSTLALTAAQLKTLDVNSTADEAFDTGTLGTVVSTVDLSGFAAATVTNGVTVTLSTSAVNGATVTGSGNDDTLNGSSQNDTINGGLGVDTIDALLGSDTVDGGAGADVITIGKGGLDTVTGGDGSDDFVVAVATTFSTTADKTVITDFNAGTATTSVDQINIDLATLNAIATTGGFATTVTDINDGSGNTAVDDTNATLVLQTMSGDGVAMASTTEMMLIDIGTYATDAKIETAFAASELTFTVGNAVTDNDAFLIAYKTGTDVNIAVAQMAGTGTSSDGIDGVETILTLQGITDFTDLNSGDFIIS